MKKWLLKNRFMILLFLITATGALFRFYQLSDKLYFQSLGFIKSLLKNY